MNYTITLFNSISDWNNLDDRLKCSDTLYSFKSHFFELVNS